MKDVGLILCAQGFLLSFLVQFSSLNYRQNNVATARGSNAAPTKCWQAQFSSGLFVQVNFV